MGFTAAFLVALGMGVSLVQGGGTLDGFTIGHVPPRTGELVSDFTYEWEEVGFVSRVWERQVEDTTHRVDLQVIVMRGKRLATPAELRAFLTEYEERDFAGLEEFRDSGFISTSEAFWVVDPGVAVLVRVDPERFGGDELRAVALGVGRA